jgi:hypothetical protein
MTLGSSNISERSLAIDERVGWIVTLDRHSIGFSVAWVCGVYLRIDQGESVVVFAADAGCVYLLGHGFGIAAVMLLYMAMTKLRKQKIDMRCVDTIAMYLFYIFIIDFSLEMLDLIHRIYEADESFRSLELHGAHAALYSAYRDSDFPGHAYAADSAGHYAGGEAAGDCAQADLRHGRLPGLIGVFAMRWNVVIGGQLFQRAFSGTRPTR